MIVYPFVQTAPVVVPRRVVRLMPVEIKVAAVQVSVPVPSGNPQGGQTTQELQQPGEFGSGLTEMLSTVLAQSRYFLPQELDAPVAVGLQIRATVTRLAVQLGGKGIKVSGGGGTGAQKRLKSEVGVDVRLVDSASGLVLEGVHVVKSVEQVDSTLDLDRGTKLSWSQAQGASLGEAARLAFVEAVRRLELRLAREPWEGMVVRVADDDGQVVFYVNAGERAGLRVGDRLEIRRAGVVLQDPETKQPLGRTPGKRLGLVRVRAVAPLLAELVPVDPFTCQEGDCVIFLSRALQR